ncbi:MAG TPA: methionyl-tRNA formyltransferase, partial [Xanthomonadales bacterium]|nr:methionyl-tRNA formyltransferase [Xanthomonadales bacterium]
AAAGAQVLAEGLALLRANRVPVAQPQREDGATYAAKIDKAEAVLDLARPALELERAVRAFHPWPVAELVLGGERLRVHAARALPQRHDAAPGTILAATRDGLDLATGDGVLRLVRVQREGGRPIAIADYLNARRDLALPA